MEVNHVRVELQKIVQDVGLGVSMVQIMSVILVIELISSKANLSCHLILVSYTKLKY